MIPRTIFNEDHDLFRDTVAKFAEREIAPHHGAWEDAGVVPREAWAKAPARRACCAPTCRKTTAAAGPIF